MTFILIVLSLLVVIVIIVAGIFFFQPRPILNLLASTNRDVLFFVQTDRPVVALTIDDGPHEQVTPKILEVLDANDARATFFVLGENAVANTELVAEIRSRGHELGNHLWTDYTSIFLSPGEFESQLSRVDTVLQISGEQKWFRPGSGWFSGRMLAQAKRLGYRCCLASIYPHDTKIRNIDFISSIILSRISPGAIIVLHDGSADRIRTVEVLRKVLPEIRRKGYTITTVSDLVRKGVSG